MWLALLWASRLEAQTQQEWADNVNWDGISHWSEYLIFSPKFSGPNAMPVPEVSNGNVDYQSYLRIGGQYHTRSGDHTGNLTLYAGHTFLKNRISIDVFMVPLELYKLSDARKVERNVYFENFDQNTAIGDLYINTNIQILNEAQNKIDMATRTGIKTASSGLDNPARFIDSPGYYFDASVGKSFTSEKIKYRPYGMLGFFAWQTNDESLRQNDALLYGVGVDITSNKWELSQTFRGYSGYHEIGDKPIVLKTSIKKDLGNHQLSLDYQHGLRDYLYQSIELSFQFVFKKL